MSHALRKRLLSNQAQIMEGMALLLLNCRGAGHDQVSNMTQAAQETREFVADLDAEQFKIKALLGNGY